MKFISAVTECIGRFNDWIRCATLLSFLCMWAGIWCGAREMWGTGSAFWALWLLLLVRSEKTKSKETYNPMLNHL